MYLLMFIWQVESDIIMKYDYHIWESAIDEVVFLHYEEWQS